MDKAVRGKALTCLQKACNKCISSIRSGIERVLVTNQEAIRPLT